MLLVERRECRWHFLQQRRVRHSPDPAISISRHCQVQGHSQAWYVTFKTTRISNKVRLGTRSVKYRFSDVPSIIGQHLKVSYAFLLNVRNEVSFRPRRSWPVQKTLVIVVGFCAYQQFGSQVLSFVRLGTPSMWTLLPSSCGTSVVPIYSTKPLGL